MCPELDRDLLVHRCRRCLGFCLLVATFIVESTALTQQIDRDASSVPATEVQVTVHDATGSSCDDGFATLARNIRLSVQDVDDTVSVGQATVVTISSVAPLSWVSSSSDSISRAVRVFALALTPPLFEVTAPVDEICSAQPASAMLDVTSTSDSGLVGESQAFTTGSSSGSGDRGWSWRATIRHGDEWAKRNGSSLVRGHVGEETEARFFRSNLPPGRRYLCVAVIIQPVAEGSREDVVRFVQPVAFADFLGVTQRLSLEDPLGEALCATVDPATRPVSRASAEPHASLHWVRCTIELAGWFPVDSAGELRLSHAQGRRLEKRTLQAGSAYLGDLVLVVDIAAQPHVRKRHLHITVVTYHVGSDIGATGTVFLVNGAETSRFERQVAAEQMEELNRVSTLEVKLLAPHHGSLWIDDALLPMDFSDEPIAPEEREAGLIIANVTAHISDQILLSVVHSAAERAQPVEGILLEVILAFPRTSETAGTLFRSPAFPCRSGKAAASTESPFTQTWTCPVTSHDDLYRLLANAAASRSLATPEALFFEWRAWSPPGSSHSGATSTVISSLSTSSWTFASHGPVLASRDAATATSAAASLATVSNQHLHLWCLRSGHHSLEMYARDGNGGNAFTWASCGDPFITPSTASGEVNTEGTGEKDHAISVRRCSIPLWSVPGGTTLNVTCGLRGAAVSTPLPKQLQVVVPFGLRLLHREQPAFAAYASLFHEASRRADLVSDIHAERLHDSNSAAEERVIRAAVYLPSRNLNSKKLFDIASWERQLLRAGDSHSHNGKPHDVSPEDWIELVVAGDKREHGAPSRRRFSITSVPGTLPLRSGWLLTWACTLREHEAATSSTCDVHAIPLLFIPHAVPSPLTASFRLRCGTPSDVPCTAYAQVHSRVVLLPQAGASRTTWSPAAVASSWCKSLSGHAATHAARVTLDTEMFLTQQTGDSSSGDSGDSNTSERDGTSGTVVFRVNRPTVEEFGRTNTSGVFGPFAVCSDFSTDILNSLVVAHFSHNGLVRMPQGREIEQNVGGGQRATLPHGNQGTAVLVGTGSFTSCPLVQAVAFPPLSRTVRTLGDSWWGLFVTNLGHLSHALGVAKSHRASPLPGLLSRHALRIVPLPETHGARDYMSRRKTFRLCSAQAIGSNETLRAYSLVASDAMAVAEAAAAVFPTAQLSGPPVWVVRTPGSLYGERAICADVDGVQEFVGVLSIPGPSFASAAFDAIVATDTERPANRRVQWTSVALGQPVELGFSIVVSSAAEFLRSSFQLLRYEDGGWNAAIGIDKPSMEDRSGSSSSPRSSTQSPEPQVNALEMDSPVRYEEVLRPSLPSLVERVIFPVLRVHVPGHYLVGFAKGLAWDGATRRGTAARSREQQHLLQTLKDALHNAPITKESLSMNRDDGSQQETIESPAPPPQASWWEYVGVAAILGVNRTTSLSLPTLTDVRVATILVVEPVPLEHQHVTVTSLPPGVVQFRIAAGNHRSQLREVAVWATVCSSSSSHSKHAKASPVGDDESLTEFSGTLRAKTVLHNSDGSLELRFLLKTENLCEKSRLSLAAGWRRVQQSVVSRARLASKAAQVETTRIVWRILCRDMVIPRPVLDDIVLATASFRGDSLHREAPSMSQSPQPPLGTQGMDSDKDDGIRGRWGADGSGTERLDAMDLDGIDEI